MKCPYCGELSQKVHSTYEREIQELQLQNKKLYCWFKQFLCLNSECRKTFSERLLFADAKGKKTYRWKKVLFMF